MDGKKTCALYARCSTKLQEHSIAMQLKDLRLFAGQRGFEIFKEYCDEGVSGTVDSRPALDQLMSDARKKRFDAVCVWRFDRFARSVRHLVGALEEFKHLGIAFVSFNENLDTSSPMGAAMFAIIGAISQLERDLIIQRVKAGLQNARTRGVKLGRKPVPVDIEVVSRISQLRSEGHSLRKIAGQLQLSKGTVQRILEGTKIVAGASVGPESTSKPA